jgi:acyl-CoA synthetase (AMP-forming)/AMP-acid ligase II
MSLEQQQTIGKAFRDAVARHRERPLLAVPASDQRDYLRAGIELSYGECLSRVEQLRGAYERAGYGHGHRVATLLDNRPEYLLHKLALNELGVSVAPINPQYRPAEMAYLLDHCTPDLLLVLPAQEALTREAMALAANPPPLALLDDKLTIFPDAHREPPHHSAVDAATEASLLYTSGTTGRPKGCVLSHGYELAVGDWYATRGGTMTLHVGTDRIFNPLPLYHINASVVSFYGAMAVGCCQIIPDRFHPSTWWRDVAASDATIIHYLGVVVSMLMKRAVEPMERSHQVRVGIGAGVEPTLHAGFEARFGFPLTELWGMTEAVRILAACHEPRQVGTRAMGRAVPGLQVRVVDAADDEVPTGEPGEMLVRYDAQTPRKHAFSGYLNDPQATEESWRGGWFHTGDTVIRDGDGMLHFVDRHKNIIRRSGENISAAEVEAVLLAHDDVAQAAVTSVADPLREEEVMACITPVHGVRADQSLARKLAAHCVAQMAYYKAPGWIIFMAELPMTGTQKIQKHRLFGDDEDPTARDDVHDVRDLKTRR